MAKDRSFVAKLAKGTKEALKARQCPKCGEVATVVKLVDSEKNASTWRFKEKFVLVCKCNEKEVYA
ncbi:MAG: hypothetical protein ONB16_02000 [candidate division KSB1 bacterium]|nr:hypothetical protein [candidate division KSB1 bacterium]MDZ7317907.1 hypothetical protein [candidate division KSB1 bacterium]MDZ7339885.1 hypothetical protein [candidate division KSB1 bacterium]